MWGVLSLRSVGVRVVWMSAVIYLVFATLRSVFGSPPVRWGRSGPRSVVTSRHRLWSDPSDHVLARWALPTRPSSQLSRVALMDRPRRRSRRSSRTTPSSSARRRMPMAATMGWPACTSASTSPTLCQQVPRLRKDCHLSVCPRPTGFLYGDPIVQYSAAYSSKDAANMRMEYVRNASGYASTHEWPKTTWFGCPERISRDAYKTHRVHRITTPF